MAPGQQSPSSSEPSQTDNPPSTSQEKSSTY
jgi:hypothetical protein